MCVCVTVCDSVCWGGGGRRGAAGSNMRVRAFKDEVQKRTHLEQQLHVSRQQESFLVVN